MERALTKLPLLVTSVLTIFLIFINFHQSAYYQYHSAETALLVNATLSHKLFGPCLQSLNYLQLWHH